MDRGQSLKSPKSPKTFYCEKCDYKCYKLCEYNKHLSTAKHNRIQGDNNISVREYRCDCGKKYNFSSGLSKHKTKCYLHRIPHTPPLTTTKDDLIEKLAEELSAERAEKSEMKSMFMMMMEKYQEMQTQNHEMQNKSHEMQMGMQMEMQKQNNEFVNKVIDVMPKMGNNNNNHNTTNNTLNFYLANTCKDAESIHDFTDRYVKQCSDFFIGNYRDIANNQMCLATNVYDIMFKCLKENPQYMNFIQTTDVKNGVIYVKEKKKDEQRQLYGEAEFIKYVDGFERAGASIGHAINKAFVPLQSEFAKKLEREVGQPPIEDEYEDEDEYEEDLYRYKVRKQDTSRHLHTHVYNAMSLFDSKTRKMEVLTKTRRIKSEEESM